MAEVQMVKDMKTWVEENKDTVFRYVVYRRMWTPYEMEHKFSDESEYRDIMYSFGKIVDVIDLGGGEWFIGFSSYDNETRRECSPKIIEYYRLSEIRLSIFEYDAITDDDGEPDDGLYFGGD